MAWDKHRVETLKEHYTKQIKSGAKKPCDYMQEYKKAVETEDYEACQALTEVLEPLNYFTADTHRYIKSLNQ